MTIVTFLFDKLISSTIRESVQALIPITKKQKVVFRRRGFLDH
jgi:hypothetical protein